MNTYTYAVNNPTDYFDPDGLKVQFICRHLEEPLATATALLMGKAQKHCFVYVTCPKEGWSYVLSLFDHGSMNRFPITGRKSLATLGTPSMPDDPTSPKNTDNIEIQSQSCSCDYEKEVMQRFMSFPSEPVPYFPLGPNSNSFAGWLVTSPTRGIAAPNVSDAPGLGYEW